MEELEGGITCNFDKNGICTALACYSSETKCGARDKDGHPIYGDIKKES